MAASGLAQADEATVSRTGEKVQTTRPIEAFVSPDNLFWHETGTMAGLYQAQFAYDRPHGKRIGEVVMWTVGCYGNVYRIERRLSYAGKRYYEVKRAELKPGAPATGLPLKGYIPTRNKDGRHAGDFSSRGC